MEHGATSHDFESVVTVFLLKGIQSFRVKNATKSTICETPSTLYYMKVLHSISSIDKTAGGTAVYMQLLGNALASKVDLKVATTHSLSPLQFSEMTEVFFSKRTFPYFGKYAASYHRMLETLEPDILHGNNLWEYPVHAMAAYATKNRIPYLISPHGTLEPWALHSKKLKKQMALLLYQRSDLQHAHCLHATAPTEAESIRNLGFKNPIAILPNGINLAEYVLSEKTVAKKNNFSKKTFLFLSRIHPIKGIEMLLEAWQKIENAQKADWQIIIAGNGDPKYIQTIQEKIRDKKMTHEIKMIGPLFGDEKTHAVSNAEIFILPTYSENFGIVIAEALACKTPVITTQSAPWSDLITHNCGWWTETNPNSIAQAMENAMLLTEAKRMEMGENGRNLIEQKYNIDKIADHFIHLYRWLLKQDDKPSFVYNY